MEVAPLPEIFAVLRAERSRAMASSMRRRKSCRKS
jgi:hypothetical protein